MVKYGNNILLKFGNLIFEMICKSKKPCVRHTDKGDLVEKAENTMHAPMTRYFLCAFGRPKQLCCNCPHGQIVSYKVLPHRCGRVKPKSR